MRETKFYDIITTQGNVSINVNNIASIEENHFGCKIIMDVLNENGQNVIYIGKLPWETVASNIAMIDKNQG